MHRPIPPHPVPRLPAAPRGAGRAGRRCCFTAVALAALGAVAGAAAAPPTEPSVAPPPVADAVWLLLQQRGLVAPTAAEPTPTSASASAPAPRATAAPAAGLAQRWRDAAADAVVTALNFLGVPYRAGGRDGDEGFDCSGFTRHVFYLTLGRWLPRRADEQARDAQLVAVPRDQLRPGDLVFFDTLQHAFSHVGIYIGDERFIHAPRAGAVVRIDDMRQSYWARRFAGARRADTTVAAAAPTP